MPATKTILYVDDYADNRQLLQRILESEGYCVIQASDGSEALNKLQKEKLSLALIDLHLPDTNGYELGERIREQPGYLQLPIIFVTAGDRELKLQKAATPYDAYFQKPFELDGLLREIRSRLGLDPAH